MLTALLLLLLMFGAFAELVVTDGAAVRFLRLRLDEGGVMVECGGAIWTSKRESVGGREVKEQQAEAGPPTRHGEVKGTGRKTPDSRSGFLDGFPIATLTEALVRAIAGCHMQCCRRTVCELRSWMSTASWCSPLHGMSMQASSIATNGSVPTSKLLIFIHQHDRSGLC